MELQRTKDLYLTLLDKLKSNTVKNIKITDDKIRFELEVVKPHITYTECVELPMTKWFKNQYCLTESVKEDYKDITFFTVNPFDDGFFKNGEPSGKVEKICFNSWKKRFNVKVFNYDHPIVQECKEKYKFYYDWVCSHKGYENRFADIVRLEILARYSKHLYFDTDTYLTEFNVKDLTHFQCIGAFMIMYNGDDLETAKKLLSAYNGHNAFDSQGILLLDRDIIKIRLEIPQLKGVSVIHLPNIDNSDTAHYVCYTNDENECKKLIDKYLSTVNEKETRRLVIYTDELTALETEYDCIRLRNIHKLSKADHDLVLSQIKSIKTYLTVEDKMKVILSTMCCGKTELSKKNPKYIDFDFFSIKTKRFLGDIQMLTKYYSEVCDKTKIYLINTFNYFHYGFDKLNVEILNVYLPLTDDELNYRNELYLRRKQKDYEIRRNYAEHNIKCYKYGLENLLKIYPYEKIKELRNGKFLSDYLK